MTALKRRLGWRKAEGCRECTPRETRGSSVKTADADMTRYDNYKRLHLFTPSVPVFMSLSDSLQVGASIDKRARPEHNTIADGFDVS